MHEVERSDASLVEALPRDESGDDLRELYRRYAGELYGFACNALSDRDLAEEIVQDVFDVRGSMRTATTSGVPP